METLFAPANDNAPFDAQFEQIPEAFLHAYSNEIMGWAARLIDKGNLLTIDLWSPPGATVISVGWQGRATLRCDVHVHAVTKKVLFVIRPHTEEDVERVRKHCEVLPGILAAHKAAARDMSQKRRKQARWVFDGTVPDYFVQRYQTELRAWAANLKKIGTTKHIVLREGNQADLSPDPEFGAQLIQVSLKCKIERIQGDELQIVVSAADDEQEWLIKRHCEKLTKAGIPAGMVLVEPDRPFVPFMPTIDRG
jgi:hypothetical protein